MHPLVSILLVRESPEQLTGSGCCGKLEADQPLEGAREVFAHSRADQEAFGVLHRTVRKFFPPVDGVELVSIVSVDPRNQLYLASKLWRDVWHFRPPIRALKTGFQLFAVPAVIVNGRVISRRGEPLDPDALCHEISAILKLAAPGSPRAAASRT